MRIHDARALRRGHLLEHLYREVRAPRIHEGASEVQRTITAKEFQMSIQRINSDSLAAPSGFSTPSRPPAAA